MKKKFIFQILILLQCVKISAQQIPTIIPPSPQAQAFMRYGEIPVSHSTGVPNIEIPIYTIEGKNLKLPISISYHASGIKVNDVASEVGLGWVLNCGGMVSRTINSISDESRHATRTYNSASQLLNDVVANAPIYDNTYKGYLNIMNFEHYFNSTFKEEDPMSDRFFYSLPTGNSGIFMFDYLNDTNLITLPYRPLKIKKTVSNLNTPDAKIENLNIIDENGTIYIFKSFLTALPKSYSEWYLVRMISVDGSEIIEWNYVQQGANQTTTEVSHQLTVQTADRSNDCTPGPTPPYSSVNQNISASTFMNKPYLKSIVSSTSIVHFNYDIQARSDFPQLKRLSSITISPVNSQSNIIKHVQFNPKYFGSNSTDFRLGLDSIIISTPSNIQTQKYAFTYENQALPPYPYKMNIPKYPQDFWGYYNGKNNTTLIQSDFIENQYDKNSYGADRYPDPNFSRACMLKEIKYPTGGKTVFQFEQNYASVYLYRVNNQDGYVGGLRICSITNYNEKNEVTNVKTYEYNGAVAKTITKDLFKYVQYQSQNIEYIDGREGWKRYCIIQNKFDIVLSNPLLPLEVGPGLPIMYTNVVEYNGTKTNNAGKTVYKYNPSYSPSDFFSNAEHPLNFEEARFYNSNHYDKGNYVPELISKTDYTFNGTSYHPVLKTKNVYTKLFTKKFQTGIMLTRTHTFPDIISEAYGFFLAQDYIRSIVAIDTKAYQEASLLTSTKNYSYNPVDSTKYIVTTTDFEYEPNYTKLIKQTTTTSDSEKRIITEFKYPFDYIEQPYTTMVQMNNITPVIEQIDKVNTTPVKSIKMNHTYWKNDGVSSSVAYGSMEIEKGIQNTSFSTFSITNSSEITIDMNLQMSIGHCKLSISGPTVINDFFYGRGGGEETFYTDYISKKYNLSSGNYTVSLSYISANGYANTGFYGTANYSVNTSGSKLNSSISSEPTSRIYPSSIDVKYGDNPYITKLNYNSYDMNGNIMSISKNDNINEVYIWSYNTNYPIAKIVNSNYSTIEGLLGGWMTVKNFSLKQHPTDAEIQSFLAPLLDNTTEETKNILVTTYTYKPLVGITSATDPRGVTTYYEYDEFNRLKQTYIIEGGVKKILQDLQYNYKN